jgi:hypothetical protein|tara:strand:+ start:339 stop:665 length:327 start_codon:yes stop_codon:yes gene_type:complete
MANAVKKLKQDEKKQVLAYVKLKLTANRVLKELDTLRQNIVNVHDRTKQNLIIVQDEHGNSFGSQKINRKRKQFDKDKFKVKYNDLYNEYQKIIEYSEYKAIGSDANA